MHHILQALVKRIPKLLHSKQIHSVDHSKGCKQSVLIFILFKQSSQSSNKHCQTPYMYQDSTKTLALFVIWQCMCVSTGRTFSSKVYQQFSLPQNDLNTEKVCSLIFLVSFLFAVHIKFHASFCPPESRSRLDC